MQLELSHISEFKVRDYECDLQGIVNNANYFHYLEQSRHEFLQEHNIDFKGAHDRGLDLVVAKAELDFIKPLGPNDRFIVMLKLSKEGYLRYIFSQRIYRLKGKNVLEQLSDGDFSETEFILSAKITCVCVNRKKAKPCKFELLDELTS